MKQILIETGVILACYLILTLPVAGATNVNIMQNGVVKETVDYTPENVVNQVINYKKSTGDVTWSNVNIHITINSASLSQTIKKIYMYKCKTSSPSSCVQKTPEVFDSYLDTEIAWKDISDREGTSAYPQAGNLLFLVKLEDNEGMVSWVGIWNSIRRTSTKEFIFRRNEVSEINIHSKSAQYIEPIRAYIENFNMIPFKWVNKVVFGNTDSMYVLGASGSDLSASTPVFSAVEPQDNEIDTIGKEYHFVFPSTSSGVAVPVTLNDNPTFTCGDGVCQKNIGENEISCCYDCGCDSGYYCNSPSQQPSDGTCESEDRITLNVRSVPMVDIEDCRSPADIIIPIEVNNPPANLPDTVRAEVELGGDYYTVTCTEDELPNYNCPVRMAPGKGCGRNTETLEDNSVSITINYNDGPSQVTKKLSATFNEAKINYECDCGEGYYCDTGTNTCESESAIKLGITSLTSYLDSYSQGDTINLKAKVFNPPTGLVLVSSSAYLNLTNGIVSPGSPTCTGPDADYVYDCSIPFSITSYSEQYNYKFEPNTLKFEVTYNDGPTAKTRNLETKFGPISIPSQQCGDGKIDPDETPENCCIDAGCPSSEQYCDQVKGCQLIEGICLTASLYPTNFSDCTEEHTVRITANVENPPAEMIPKNYVFITNGMITTWNVDKADRSLGIYEFLVEIPALEGGCELPYYALAGNEIQLTIEFKNGHTTLQKKLNTTLENIYIRPQFHPGDGVCEVKILENASNSCLDCPCEDDSNYGEGYYCSFDRETKYGGCEPKSNVSLVIDSPTSPVKFDSCEEHNYVTILGHIENAPKQGFKIESQYASMNGESVNVRKCKEIENHNDSLFELNCSIAIPPEKECTQGETYPYSNNTFSVVIIYETKDGKAVQTLTSPFADVSITQGIRTMYDIMQDNTEQLQESLDRIMDVADKTADAIAKCMKLQMMAMLISVVLSVGFMLWGGLSGAEMPKDAQGVPLPGSNNGVMSTGDKFKYFDTESASKFGDIGAGIGKTLTEAIDAICKTIQAKMEIAMQMEKVKMAQTQMHTCLELVQHQMDTGACLGQESSCFDKMQSCVEKGVSAISSATKEMNSIIDGLTKEYKDVTTALSDIMEDLDDDSTSTTGPEYIKLEINSDEIYNNADICMYEDENTVTGAVKIKISSSKPKNTCNYVTVVVDNFKKSTSLTGTVEIAANVKEFLGDYAENGKKQHEVIFYCSNTDGGTTTKIGNMYINYYGKSSESDTENTFWCGKDAGCINEAKDGKKNQCRESSSESWDYGVLYKGSGWEPSGGSTDHGFNPGGGTETPVGTQVSAGDGGRQGICGGSLKTANDAAKNSAGEWFTTAQYNMVNTQLEALKSTGTGYWEKFKCIKTDYGGGTTPSTTEKNFHVINFEKSDGDGEEAVQGDEWVDAISAAEGANSVICIRGFCPNTKEYLCCEEIKKETGAPANPESFTPVRTRE